MTFERITAVNVDRLAAGLTQLERQVRGRRRDPAFWRWCYIDAPGGGGLAAVALDGHRVVGKLGSVAVRLEVDGEPVVASLLEGLAVLPERRSWACYRGLSATCLEAARERGVPFGFSFATREAAEINERTGWARLGRVPIATGILSLKTALECRSLPKPLAAAGRLLQPFVGLHEAESLEPALELRTVERFDGAFDSLWRARSATRRVAPIKDAAYLNWRYRDCPGLDYACRSAHLDGELEGAIVFCIDGRRGEGFLLDLWARPQRPEVVLQSLVSHALEAMRRERVGLVRAVFPEGATAADALRRRGFRLWATRWWAMELVVTSAGGPEAVETVRDAWDFSLGDWLYH